MSNEIQIYQPDTSFTKEVHRFLDKHIIPGSNVVEVPKEVIKQRLANQEVLVCIKEHPQIQRPILYAHAALTPVISDTRVAKFLEVRTLLSPFSGNGIASLLMEGIDLYHQEYFPETILCATVQQCNEPAQKFSAISDSLDMKKDWLHLAI